MDETVGQDAAGRLDEGSRLGDVLLGAARGAVGAMAMTGMRVQAVRLVDRLALAADHLLYGLVLSGSRRGVRG